jgi:hypothetical protein
MMAAAAVGEKYQFLFDIPPFSQQMRETGSSPPTSDTIGTNPTKDTL